VLHVFNLNFVFNEAVAIADGFGECMEKFGIGGKCGKTTTDGGSDLLNRLNCMRHIFHLVVCHATGI